MDTPHPVPDRRSAITLIRQWREIEQVRRQLTRLGILGPDAAPADVIAALRHAIPIDLFDPGPQAKRIAP